MDVSRDMNPRSFACLSALALVALSGCSEASMTQPRRPFTLGPAIQEQCGQEGTRAAFCQPLNASIAQMLAEPRDAAWADAMERRIDEMMQVNGKYWAEIRSLECRRTLCALEYVAAIDPALNVNAEAFDGLLSLLEPVTGGVGYELPNAGGEGRVVGVMVFKRASAAN